MGGRGREKIFTDGFSRRKRSVHQSHDFCQRDFSCRFRKFVASAFSPFGLNIPVLAKNCEKQLEIFFGNIVFGTDTFYFYKSLFFMSGDVQKDQNRIFAFGGKLNFRVIFPVFSIKSIDVIDR
jgi:hypothetical protein